MNYELGRAVSITPSDSDDLDVVPRAIYVGGSGDVKVDMLDGSTVTFKSLQAGEVHWIRPRRVYSTDTTATDIIGLYCD